MKGILGRKIGMTQVFNKVGKLVPVTVIEIEPNIVTQIKTIDKDGYEAIQLGAVSVREKVSSKPKMGHTAKAQTTPKRFLREIKGVDINNYQLGAEVKADLFEAGEIVDVTGISKGKGYQGVIKKDNQHRGPMSHGSKHHRLMGSLGTMQPKRVFKGKAMASHMGVDQVTIQNLEIIKVDMEDNCLLVKGSVPGANKSLVIIKSAVKTDAKNDPFEIITYGEEEVLEETNLELGEDNKDDEVSFDEEINNVEETNADDIAEEETVETEEEIADTKEVTEEPNEEISEEKEESDETSEESAEVSNEVE